MAITSLKDIQVLTIELSGEELAQIRSGEMLRIERGNNEFIEIYWDGSKPTKDPFIREVPDPLLNGLPDGAQLLNLAEQKNSRCVP